ncbi:hypothetical protein TKK_0015560 [Trichogramma kaykai]
MNVMNKFQLSTIMKHYSYPQGREYKSATPEILSPKNSPKWRYVSPESLAIGGIYSEKDTRKLRNLIVFPLERGAVLNKILKSATGRQGVEVRQFKQPDMKHEAGNIPQRPVAPPPPLPDRIYPQIDRNTVCSR